MKNKRTYVLKLFPFAALIFLTSVFMSPLQAQWNWNDRLTTSEGGMAMGGLGMAFIDGESYWAFNLRTELAMGKFGLGLDIPLRFDTENGKLRTEDWDSSYDYFRILRYIRYGTKRRSQVYARLGMLDGSRLGHGFIMNYYTNEANYDNRKIGTEFDLKFRKWGVETVVSNYERLEIVGSRFHITPLRDMNELLLFKKLTFGASLVTDRDPDQTGATDDEVTITGLDVELPLIYTGPFFSKLYADYASIDGFGSGKAVGIEMGLWKLGGLMTIQAKLERRFLGKEFVPSYFDPFYEVQRFQVVDTLGIRKTDLLLARTSSEMGYYGELFGHVLNIVKLLGTFERIDGNPQSGRLHLAAILSKALPKISARAVYDKTGIDTFGDAFTLDDRSILRAGFGYQINSFLYLFTDYVWTFELNETSGELKSQRRIEPQLSLVLPLNFGGR